MKITIKLHQDCLEGRHVFIPISWESCVKSQTKWVTELTCQHCLEFISSHDWFQHMNSLKQNYPLVPEMEAVKQLTPQQILDIEKENNLRREVEDLVEKEIVKNNEKLIKKRGRPFANR